MIIVFDFDGTMANTRKVLIEVYNELADKHGFKKVTPQDYLQLRKQGYVSILRWTGVHFWQIPGLISEGRRLFSRRSSDVRLFPGIKEPIKELNTRGHECYVLSSNTPRTIKKIIQAQDLGFMRILPAANLFGKAATLKSLKKKHPGQEMIMIGDELRDIQAAHKAGAKAFAVTWGLQAEDVLKSAQPDVIIASTGDITKAIDMYTS